jgi:hypothetical protein
MIQQLNLPLPIISTCLTAHYYPYKKNYFMRKMKRTEKLSVSFLPNAQIIHPGLPEGGTARLEKDSLPDDENIK